MSVEVVKWVVVEVIGWVIVEVVKCVLVEVVGWVLVGVVGYRNGLFTLPHPYPPYHRYSLSIINIRHFSLTYSNILIDATQRF